jgi:hypothetical protein
LASVFMVKAGPDLLPLIIVAVVAAYVARARLFPKLPGAGAIAAQPGGS